MHNFTFDFIYHIYLPCFFFLHLHLGANNLSIQEDQVSNAPKNEYIKRSIIVLIKTPNINKKNNKNLEGIKYSKTYKNEISPFEIIKKLSNNDSDNNEINIELNNNNNKEKLIEENEKEKNTIINENNYNNNNNYNEENSRTITGQSHKTRT